MTAAGWAIERTIGSARTFHHRPPPAPLRPTVWIHQVDRPALVLGSTQRAPLVDSGLAELEGVEVCQRRSGGGLVLVDPGASVWIDVFVPRGHGLWSDDVGLAFDWIGQTWATALRRVGAGEHAVADEPVSSPGAARPMADHDRPGPLGVAVHRGPMKQADWGRVICFAGIGPGEVLVDGRKVVGLSQRRTHDVARFQSLAVTDLGVASLRRYLMPGALPSDLDAVLDELPVGTDLDLSGLHGAFLDSLPPA